MMVTRALSALLACWFTSGVVAAGLEHYEIVAKHPLPAEIAEASGLACTSDGKYTINDSGNPAIIFQLGDQGQIVGRIHSALNNRDWEALSYADGQLYVADIGNNHGHHRAMKIHRVALASVNKGIAADASSFSFEFADYDQHPVTSVHHDLDAEAITIDQGQLIVFSKSWQSNVARVYRMIPRQQHQVIEPVATIAELPGMITGAHFDPVAKQYWLVGYNSKGLPKLKPFIAQLDDNFQLLATKSLTGLGQIEAVCMDQQRRLWLAQEQMLFKPALLIEMAAQP
ncbi:hypothetical protein IC617_11140 [Neiella sp. HB171785]|uniref:Esterase-like activity of phytase family protein n=1 Tax=Neiella litorisoli TaxID=2771431 RepID=A0A8J6UEU0_9GAMM|nr:hypothetical protein [Neiella litorisoli]MBD1389984.1 hypothetical protein [Neiella litorisoli]